MTFLHVSFIKSIQLEVYCFGQQSENKTAILWYWINDALKTCEKT